MIGSLIRVAHPELIKEMDKIPRVLSCTVCRLSKNIWAKAFCLCHIRRFKALSRKENKKSQCFSL